jgi:hypothetical protein
MQADEGESLNGFRSGCAITLALTGGDISEIMEHVGWARRHTSLYYLQLSKVLNPSGASARLAEPSASEAATPWKDVNQLNQFVCAFPSKSSQKEVILSVNKGDLLGLQIVMNNVVTLLVNKLLCSLFTRFY